MSPVISFAIGADPINVHSFVMENIQGEKINLADYKGKALLIVNTGIPLRIHLAV